MACVVLSCLGCAASTDEETEEPVDSSSQELRGRRRITIPRDAPYFADVNAEGSGCPTGTWDVAISEDGETFTLRFSQYEATLAPGQERDVKECQIDLNLGSSNGLSYSIASFYYQGYALLDKPGMKARQLASYSFRGHGHRQNDEDKNELTGPIDESYLFADEIGDNRRLWSPCRRDDGLRIKTRLVLRNDPTKSGSGYMNTATVDGSLAFQVKVKWRRCRDR